MLLPSFVPPLPSPPTARHPHKNTHTNFPKFSEAWSNPSFSPFIPGKSLWVLIALLGGIRGQKQRSNLVEAEQKWNSRLTEEQNNPSLTVWTSSLPFALLLRLIQSFFSLDI